MESVAHVWSAETLCFTRVLRSTLAKFCIPLLSTVLVRHLCFLLASTDDAQNMPSHPKRKKESTTRKIAIAKKATHPTKTKKQLIPLLSQEQRNYLNLHGPSYARAIKLDEREMFLAEMYNIFTERYPLAAWRVRGVQVTASERNLAYFRRWITKVSYRPLSCFYLA